MSAPSKSFSVNSADAMCQIAWLDTVERLDTLLLEIRHFQCNVIFSLKLPILYQALRFEEDYLWGTPSWFSLFRDMPSPASELRKLANNWIVPFPILPEEIVDGNTIREKIAKNILEIIQRTLSSGHWNSDALRHYRNLSILQILKSNILHDKLVICHTGWHTFSSYIENPGQESNSIDPNVIAQFMIIRSAVTMRLNDYVGRFGDLQAQFDTSLDLSLQEDPAPLINRRHEQGFYTSFMSVRCQEIQDSIDSLLSEFDLHGTDSAINQPPPIIHRWRHDFTSTTEHLYDDVGQKNSNGSEKQRRRQINTQFINSSFWMPDRPDLLSSLAHELAHYNIYEKYGDAWSPSLDEKDDKFARLLKLLNHCLDCFQINHHNPKIIPADYPESSLIEISCDLIAASVEGHAYLYVLFLELTACGELAYLLEAPKKRFDLDIHPNQYITIDPNTIGRSWYYRLKLLCSWMKAIYHHPEEDNLIIIMVDGIDKIVDNILSYISNITPKMIENSQGFWKTFTNRLCKIASRSDASRLVRKWRKSRSEYWHKTLQSETKGLLHLAPHYSRPLNVHIQNFLFRMLLNLKQSPERLLYQGGQQQQPDIDNITREFCKKYFAVKDEEFNVFSKNFLHGSNKIINKLLLGESSLLFRHIYDIPWRCVILNAIDFIHPESKINSSNWLNLFHYNSALGRELYFVALEFYLHQTTATPDRLAISARVVKRLLESNKDNGGLPQHDFLHNWLYGSNNNSENIRLNDSINNLQNEIKDYISNINNFDLHQNSIVQKKNDNKYLLNQSRSKQIDDLIQRHGALAWSSIINPLTLQTTDNNETRFTQSIRLSIINKCVGYKINELMKIINNLIENNNLNVDHYTIVDQLKLYLELWGSKKNGSNETNREKTILSLLLSLEMKKLNIKTSTGITTDEREFLSNPNYTMVGTCELKCTEIGRLTVANHMTPSINNTNTGALTSLFGLWKGRGEWLHKSKITVNHLSYFVVLGRFDIISFNYTRPMSRTCLPHFYVENPPKNMEEEKFMPFFIRREIAIPYRLKYGEDRSDQGLLTQKTTKSGGKILGFISILLTGRSSRLSFIARLIHLINFPTEKQKAATQGLSRVAQILGKNDCCLFLGEGWGDVLILFKGDTTLDYLDEIFSVQNDIYHDFLVNRTELVLTHHWLNTNFNKNFQELNEKYKITSHFRICSDQELRNANQNFTTGMKESLNNLGISDTTLLKTPGRSDFSIDITPLFKTSTYKDFINEIDEKIPSEIDDILTIISKKT